MFSTIISFVTSFFSGSSGGWVKWAAAGVGALAIAITLGWLLLSRANLKADLAQANANLISMTTAYEASQSALLSMRAKASADAKARAERDEQISKINADRDALRVRLREALKNDAETRAWADTDLPESVYGLLQ